MGCACCADQSRSDFVPPPNLIVAECRAKSKYWCAQWLVSSRFFHPVKAAVRKKTTLIRRERADFSAHLRTIRAARCLLTQARLALNSFRINELSLVSKVVSLTCIDIETTFRNLGLPEKHRFPQFPILGRLTFACAPPLGIALTLPALPVRRQRSQHAFGPWPFRQDHAPRRPLRCASWDAALGPPR